MDAEWNDGGGGEGLVFTPMREAAAVQRFATYPIHDGRRLVATVLRSLYSLYTVSIYG
eukprot:COSAG06_NODE_28033_length_582_cov_0.496894_1_plen_57_part_10